MDDFHREAFDRKDGQLLEKQDRKSRDSVNNVFLLPEKHKDPRTAQCCGNFVCEERDGNSVETCRFVQHSCHNI